MTCHRELTTRTMAKPSVCRVFVDGCAWRWPPPPPWMCSSDSPPRTEGLVPWLLGVLAAGAISGARPLLKRTTWLRPLPSLRTACNQRLSKDRGRNEALAPSRQFYSLEGLSQPQGSCSSTEASASMHCGLIFLPTHSCLLPFLDSRI